MRCLRIVGVTIAALAAGVSSAQGATVSMNGTTVEYVADAAEDNHVRIGDSVNALAVIVNETDSVALTVGAGCFQAAPGSISCGGAGGVASAHVDAGDGDDVVSFGIGTSSQPGLTRGGTVDLGPGDDHFNGNNTATATAALTVRGGDDDDQIFSGNGNDTLEGNDGDDLIFGDGSAGHGRDRIDGNAGDDSIQAGAGNDTIDGGTGQDSLLSQAGNDIVEARDGEVDHITCSDGFDTVNADQIDVLAADCVHPDADGDGLVDDWETHGVDVDGDGAVDLDLPAMGAKPDHKDVFVEIDAMAGHELEQLAVDSMVQSFAAAPLENPDGTSGIAMHVDNGPGSVMDPRTGATWGARSRHEVLPHDAVLGIENNAGDYDWTDFDALKALHFDDSRAPVFHYVVSAHRFGAATENSSGISRGIGASDLIVALGSCEDLKGPGDCTFDAPTQAGTLMHELGHNLGLQHGGADGTNNKPNYLSIMNYSFQFSWLVKADGTRMLDYSRFGTSLDERALDENHGLGAAPGSGPAAFMTIIQCPAPPGLSPVLDGPVDLNCNNTIDATTPLTADVNGDGSLGLLTGTPDWPRLVYKGGSIGSLGAFVAPRTTVQIEHPATELLAYAKIADAGPVAPPGSGPAPVPGTTPTPPTTGSTTPPTKPFGQSTPSAHRPTCSVRPRSSKVALRGEQRGRLSVSVRCDGAATARLSATATITSGRHHRTVSAGAATVRAKARATQTVVVKLPSSVLTALARHQRVSVALKLRVGSRTVAAATTKLAGRR